MSDINYQELARAMVRELGSGTVQRGLPSATPNAVMGHGRGGLFSHPALEKPIFSAMVLPIRGLQSILPVKAANTVNPLYGIFTGVTDSTGSEPVGPCDDPPYAGLSKLCMHQFVFGRQSPNDGPWRSSRKTGTPWRSSWSGRHRCRPSPGTSSSPPLRAGRLRQNPGSRRSFGLAVDE